MKKLALLFSIVLTTLAVAQSRSKVNFGTDWQFKSSETAAWEQVSLPHTARLENLVVVNQFQGVCYYQKKFQIHSSPNQKQFLYFEGVMMEAEVFVNAIPVAHHKGGYLPFTVDISKAIKDNQENVVTVKVTNVDNPEIPPGKPIKDLDFNYYGGIYRNVYLITTPKLYFTDAVEAHQKAGGGISIHFDSITAQKALGTIKAFVKNEEAFPKKVSLKAVLTETKNSLENHSKIVEIPANSSLEISLPITVNNPKLWSTQHPNLYNLEISLIADKTTIDVQNTKVGIRKIAIKEEGLYLNDVKTFLNGTNRHQEYPYIGYALSDEAQYRDAVKIKTAGFDFVRLSHYPQSEAFLNACDALGILVMDCISGWQFFGNQTFQNNSYQEIRDLAHRDRNHPSVLFWEVSLNESSMDANYMKTANAVLKEELPYKDTYTAGWIDNANYDLYIPARQHGKAPDYWTQYDKGSRKILIAEYGDWEYYAQNAGFNQKEFAGLKEEERTSRQFRSNGEKRMLQQAFNFQEAFNSNLKGKQTIGQANWLMFDYNRGYSPDIESSGVSDIFRLPKFANYFYQSQRNVNSDNYSKPMLFIASYWNENSPLDLTVYSNCDEVALYLNDTFIGKQKPAITPFSNLLPHPPFVFKMAAFQKGTLRAEGFIKGQKVVESQVSTPEVAAKVEVAADLSGVVLSKQTSDVIFVYAKITDAQGTVVPDATNEVSFAIDGATLIGQNPIKAEAGIATILVKTNANHKNIKIKATATGLQSGAIELQ